MRKRLLVVTATTVALVLALGAGPALACGALVSPNGTVQLVRTTTLAAYHNGLEHYVTGFKFEGDGAKFGSIVPLPANPSRIVRGGDWTLQRLVREVTPVQRFAFEDLAAAPTAAGAAEVVQEVNVDSLHLTVVKGGAFGVGKWATDQGFLLPPDAPAVLDFYAQRSPYFLAVQFDAAKARARGENLGDAIPIHLVMRTNEPWVPLRILGLGAGPNVRIQADVFLLTDEAPSMLPSPAGANGLGPAAPGLQLARSESAPHLLLHDLRTDKGMKWLPPHGMWFDYLKVDARAGDLTYDLGLNVKGGTPSMVDAGLAPPAATVSSTPGLVWAVVLGIALLTMLAAVGARQRRGDAKVAV